MYSTYEMWFQSGLTAARGVMTAKNSFAEPLLDFGHALELAPEEIAPEYKRKIAQAIHHFVILRASEVSATFRYNQNEDTYKAVRDFLALADDCLRLPIVEKCGLDKDVTLE